MASSAVLRQQPFLNSRVTLKALPKSSVRQARSGLTVGKSHVVRHQGVGPPVVRGTCRGSRRHRCQVPCEVKTCSMETALPAMDGRLR